MMTGLIVQIRLNCKWWTVVFILLFHFFFVLFFFLPWFVQYSMEGQKVQFYVEDDNTASALRSLSRRITDNEGYKAWYLIFNNFVLHWVLGVWIVEWYLINVIIPMSNSINRWFISLFFKCSAFRSLWSLTPVLHHPSSGVTWKTRTLNT